MTSKRAIRNALVAVEYYVSTYDKTAFITPCYRYKGEGVRGFLSEVRCEQGPMLSPSYCFTIHGLKFSDFA